MWFGLGFRLPRRNREWVRHDLTDAGWRARMVGRHVIVFAPLCALLGLVPGAWWLRAVVASLVFFGSLCSIALYTDELRAARLRQHGLPQPGGSGPGEGPPPSPWHR